MKQIAETEREKCEGGDSNARTPARPGPEPGAVDLAWLPSRLNIYGGRRDKDWCSPDPYLFFPFPFWNFFSSASRSSFRLILPEIVFGRVSTNSTRRGYL